MANRFRLEQIQEFYITPTVTQDGMVPMWNNDTKRFDWVYSFLQLGDLHTEAYYGDLGKIAYDHSRLITGNPHGVTKTDVGLSNVTNNTQWYSGNHPTTTIDYGLPDYPTTLPASDVYPWAKTSTKPAYSYSEISGTVPGIHDPITLATDSGLSLSTQVIAMGIPSTLTPTTTNTITTSTHTHAITPGLGWIGNGSAANQIPLTGTTPFTPTWTTVTSLVNLNNLSFASTAFVKMTAANTFGLDTNVYVIKSGDTGLGNMYFNNNVVIDVVSSVGTDILNIGTTNADVINIGYASSIVNINGTVSYQYATDLKVTDKLITLNVNGGIASGVSSGFEVEENDVITGWFTTSGARTGFELRAPATSYSAIFLLSSLGAERTYTYPDASGTVALTSNLHNAVTLATDSGLVLSTQVLNMGTPSNITPTTTNSVTTNTHTHAITAGLGWIGNGTQAKQMLVTGTTPFTPVWTNADNLVSLNALTFASASFVKMTGANTFALDTNTYIVSGTVPATITVANEATDTTCFPLFVTDATGNLAPKTNTGYLFNAATGRLTIPGMLNITSGEATSSGLKALQLPTGISGIDAGLSVRTGVTGESIIQFGNNLSDYYTGNIDQSKAGAMIRIDTRNVTPVPGSHIYSIFQIQTRAAGTAYTGYTVPVQIAASPNGSLCIANTGIVYFYYGINTANQITSTLATGTAPLVITSTTMVNNLNSQYATNLKGGNNTTLLGSIPYQSNTDITTLLVPNVTVTKKWLSQTGTGTNGAAPVWTTLAVSDLTYLLNDEWLKTYDYAGNIANLIKLSKDNIVEFANPVGIDVLYHVLNSGFNDIINIPVDITSPDNTQHGVGITIGGQRLFSVSALATATTALVDTPIVSIIANVGIGTTSPVSLTEIQGGLTTVGAVFTLSSKETSTVANDVLGQINFRAALDASGTDAILTAASIVAIAEGTFSASNNATSLQFRTGASEVATTKMTLTSAGNLSVTGAITSTQYKLTALNTAPANATDTGVLGEIRIVADAIYICTATNTWKKTVISTW